MSKPDSNNSYVAPTRQDAKEICWDYTLGRCHELGWSITPHGSELLIRRKKNNAKFRLCSAEKEDRFRGKKNDRIVLDEFSAYRSKTIWNQSIRPTLSDTNGLARFLFTPKGFNHAYELSQMAKTTKDWAFKTFRTIDSPFFQTPEGKEEIEAARRDLSIKDFKQEYEASFETFSGRIIYAFDRVKNNIEYDYNKDLQIIIGQDFNRSPMASALYQKVAGKLLQFDEIFLQFSNTEQVCEEVVRRFPDKARHHIIFRPDATGIRKTSNSSRSDFDIIRSYGFTIETANLNPRVIDRWAATNRAYEKELVMINIKKCTHTVRDLETLVYKEGSCEANLSDPFAGHITDASGYAIYREFPIHIIQKSRVGTYA